MIKDELAALAGGDVYELAVDEVRKDVVMARERLSREFPFFFPERAGEQSK